MNEISITSIRFKNFKALSNFSIHLTDMNVMVGPNNSGKSTIISALRILDVALRKANNKKAELVPLPTGRSGYGHRVPEEQISVSLENVATNYNDDSSQIEFRLSNKNKLFLYFPTEGGCILYWETTGVNPNTVSRFRSAFPLKIQVVPVLGPLEHEEIIVTEDTVKRALNTHRASRHFRNYWRYFPEGWDEFADMVSSTWPGMRLSKPERPSNLDGKLTMFVTEDGLDREVYWAGFGFQIWCQLLTHISRSNDSSILVIDEPEIYLHPDVQRQLLTILRDVGSSILIASHSVEIMGEADPNEILMIDKSKHSAIRLKDVEGIQIALESLGSTQNVTLTHLARTKKILFVEGLNDYKLIRRFALKVGMGDISASNEVTPFESGGFSSWERVKAFAWGLSQTMEGVIAIAAIYDRDFFCPEFIQNMQSELDKDLVMSHVHSRKEIENYLLNIPVLERVLDKQISSRESKTGIKINRTITISDLLSEITEVEKSDIQSQYIAKRQEYLSKNGKDPATITRETIKWFDEQWKSIDTRLNIVHGKKTIRLLREKVQQEYSVNLTDFQIIDAFSAKEVPADMIELIHKIHSYQDSRT
ncbi:ATP-dependent nuclease [Aeromonas hydrophila]|uniref:ATP-dependent nuclease n=1 Tax=Aeromonas hydrophila TaxID=644 RepID=UPI00207D2308|nr:ATP-binding protein [Aeromonas hydrophila]MCO4212625.1 ATP-binding protein [Aeromonas hydrophila]HDX8444630.1 AAA family ATPase [Aeromonas hydrophila]HDX8633226.1 AAA family ATPase [Aeromonas hydrophila]